MSESYSTTVVHVPGSSGDSGFHPDSHVEDVKIKKEPGIEASVDERLPHTCKTKDL